MRVLKWIAIACGSLLALVLVAFVALALFIDPNSYKSNLEQWVAKETNRPFTLQGELSWSLFPWLALRMGPAQLGERADQSRFGNQPFVSLQGARFSVKVLPLLRGDIEIGQVELLSPSVRLITDESGRHNYDDLMSAPSGQETTGGAGGFAGRVAGIAIHGGQLILDDRRAGTQTTMADLVLTVTGIESGKPFDLQSSFVLTQADAARTQAQLSAQVTADWDAKRYTLAKFDSRFQLHWQDGPEKGVTAALRADLLDMDLARQSLRLAGLNAEIGAAKLTGMLVGKEILDAPNFTGNIALAEVSPRQLAPQFRIELPDTRDTEVFKRLSFAAEVSLQSNAVELNNLQLQLDDTTARGSFAIANLETNALRFDLEVNRLDFDRYLPPPAESPGATQSSGSAAEAPTPIPVDLLRALNVRGDLQIGQAVFSGLKLSQVKIDVQARDGELRVAPARAALYGGNYQGDVLLNVAQAKPQLKLRAQASNVDFAPLLTDMLEIKRISGRGSLQADLTAVGPDTQAMLQALNGDLNFKLADGAYEGMDLWYEIRRARALIKQQPVPTRTGAERTPFTACQGSATVSNGVMSNQDLDVAMQYLKVSGKGSVDLVQSTLDYRLNAKVLRIRADDAQAAEMQDMVDAEIPVTISGKLESPKVRPDVEGYVKQRAKEEIKKESDKLQRKLQDKLKDLLRG